MHLRFVLLKEPHTVLGVAEASAVPHRGDIFLLEAPDQTGRVGYRVRFVGWTLTTNTPLSEQEDRELTVDVVHVFMDRLDEQGQPEGT